MSTEDPQWVAKITAAVREADLAFESVGGSTRHYVRDCLLPALAKAGLAITNAAPPEPRPALEAAAQALREKAAAEAAKETP